MSVLVSDFPCLMFVFTKYIAKIIIKINDKYNPTFFYFN